MFVITPTQYKLSLYIHLFSSTCIMSICDFVESYSTKTDLSSHIIHIILLVLNVSFHCPMILYSLNYIFISFLTPLISSNLQFISLFLFFESDLTLLMPSVLLNSLLLLLILFSRLAPTHFLFYQSKPPLMLGY